MRERETTTRHRRTGSMGVSRSDGISIRFIASFQSSPRLLENSLLYPSENLNETLRILYFLFLYYTIYSNLIDDFTIRKSFQIDVSI